MSPRFRKSKSDTLTRRPETDHSNYARYSAQPDSYPIRATEHHRIHAPVRSLGVTAAFSLVKVAT
jgi:serine/threonine protein phosphatase PrpC